MKKIIIAVSLFLTLFTYCQTAEEYLKKGVSKVDLNDHQGAIADYSKAIEINLKKIFFFICIYC